MGLNHIGVGGVDLDRDHRLDLERVGFQHLSSVSDVRVDTRHAICSIIAGRRLGQPPGDTLGTTPPD
jgi:hypothetical protein